MILGIDTSNYTTSVALIDDDGKILKDCRRVLPVKKGHRGLRQSEALFEHVRNLPELMRAAIGDQPIKNGLKAIGVSVAPRPVPNSYMPVFRAGIGAAEMLSDAIRVPCYRLSHQEGHIRAAMCETDIFSWRHRLEAGWQRQSEPMLAVHFSGGTSEILYVKREKKGFQCEIVGRSLDLHAGQLVDRIGVMLGMDFPAGRALERLAKPSQETPLKLATQVIDGDFHFSGMENAAKQALQKGADPANLAYALFEAVGRTLGRAIIASLEKTEVSAVLFSGGVMANGIVKEEAQKRILAFCRKHRRPVSLCFAKPRYATDNAVGCALLAKEAFEAEQKKACYD
jgi:N6-L-threonylcarbamoyladenine synthase